MASGSVVIETGHEEMIHDVQLDYYGKRLATASSDRTIKIFDASEDTTNNSSNLPLATLRGHDGPVWQVAWAHPQFGTLLASCSYDRRLIVWKEEQSPNWVKVFEFTHGSSVNSVSFAPHTLGLILAAASSDGTVSVHTYTEGKPWQTEQFRAHNGGVNSVSWAPDVPPGAVLSGQPPQLVRRFATGGCDNQIKLWRFDEGKQKWVDEVSEEKKMAGQNSHPGWVRDVAWAPSLGLPTNTIASCSENFVYIWTEDQNGAWKNAEKLKFEHKVWRVSWSVMGNILAVSQGNNTVSLWKESLDGKWKELSNVKDSDDNKASEAN